MSQWHHPYTQRFTEHPPAPISSSFAELSLCHLNYFYYKGNHVSACPVLFFSHGAMCINVKKAGQKISLNKTITNRLSSSDGVQISYKSKFTLVRVETPKNPWINPDKSPAKIFIIFSHCPCNAVQFTSVQKYQNIRIVPERESSQTAN